MSYLNFQWNQTDTKFIYEMTDPRYFHRTFFSLCTSLKWKPVKLLGVIEKWQNNGIICKKGKRVAFTYLGWPLWAAAMVARIWMQEDSNDNTNSDTCIQK